MSDSFIIQQREKCFKETDRLEAVIKGMRAAMLREEEAHRQCSIESGAAYQIMLHMREHLTIDNVQVQRGIVKWIHDYEEEK